MSNGVYFSASARVRKGIAVSSVYSLSDIANLVIVFHRHFYLQFLDSGHSEYEILPSSQRTVFIIVSLPVHAGENLE